MGDLQEINDFFDDGTVLDFFALGWPPVEHTGEGVLFHVDMAGGHEVVEGAEAGVEGDVLEGTGDAQFGDFVGGGLSMEADTPD